MEKLIKVKLNKLNKKYYFFRNWCMQPIAGNFCIDRLFGMGNSKKGALDLKNVSKGRKTFFTQN